MCCQRNGGSGVAPDGLEQNCLWRQTHFTQLFGDEESMRFIEHDHGTRGVRKPRRCHRVTGRPP